MGGVSFPGRLNARLGSGRTERYTAFTHFHTLRAYLSMDTLEKIHRPGLVPITRAAIRMIHATRGVSAAAMRQKGG